MNPIQNLHTHTTFCDGVNTVEQMIKSAIDKNFKSIGFSSHSFTTYSAQYTMPIEKTNEYKSEVRRLKEKYKGIIDVFLGLELDAYSDVDQSGYDYIIGSLHCLKMGEELVGFDRSAQVVADVIDKYFNGNGLDFAREYYRQLIRILDFKKVDVIGHFDTITKNIEKVKFFDAESDAYLKYAFEALDAMRNKIPFFEVNTGAISRGYRTSPYPMKNIITKMKDFGFGAIITSDAHRLEDLDFWFDNARELLLECGFTERYILTDSGFTSIKL